jgi:poly(3-hydroxybutyrate) depolymerase
MRKLTILCAFLGVLSLHGQVPVPSRPLTAGEQPDIQTLSRTVQALRRSAAPSGAAHVDQFLQDAAGLLAIGQSGEARRKLAHAQALITGKPWDAREEFLWSLALRPQRLAIDPALPQIIELAQVYSAPYRAGGDLRLRIALATAGSTSNPVRPVGTFEVPLRDFAAEPFKLQTDFSGTPDGPYHLTAELLEGESALVTMQLSIAVAGGIESRYPDVERRLAKITGHESAKATVRWPFDMARVVNMGIRKLESADFGLPEHGLATFDFAKELNDSADVLKALEAGKDPLVRAKGDHERHYYFEEAREIMPYRVYVPGTWNGKQQLPMIFVLHGATRDHNFYFDRDGGILAKLAEKYGYIVATTMGYRPNAGYNAGAIATLTGAAVPAAIRKDAELSEKDAMHTLDMVVREFNPDRSRIYLFGHSAGGTGGWYLASKYPGRFAGIALSAFGTQPQSVPWDKLKGIPILVIVGSKDAPRTVETARRMAKAVKEKGFDTQFLEVAEATHDTIVGLALPTVYEFFSNHRAAR